MVMIQALIGPATKLLGKFIEDKDTKNKIAFELSTMAEKHAQQLAMAQIEVNKVEAGSDSLFKSGWRPSVGWICSFALGYHFVMQPMLAFILSAFGHNIILPEFDMTTLTTILMGLLGLGGMRSFEKVKKSA